jgi:outer membrane usher protein FimD/PapC
MKLSYRGVSYDYTPPAVETTQSEFVGKYRGLNWRFSAVKKAPVQQTNLDLKYRGVAYNTNGTTTQAQALSVSEKARQGMMDRQRHSVKRQQVMLSRLNAEVGLVPVLA